MMIKDYQFENSKFHEPQVRVVALGCGHTGDIVKMLNFIISYAILLGIGQTNQIMMNKEFEDLVKYKIQEKGGGVTVNCQELRNTWYTK